MRSVNTLCLGILLSAILVMPFSVTRLMAASYETSAAPINVTIKKGIKVVYDIKTDEQQAGIGKALYYLRGLYEAYRKQGVAPEDIHLSADFHGPTVAWLLNDEAWQEHTLDPFAANPNDKVISELIELGVSIEACNATMKGHGWKAENLLPGVVLVHDAYTRMIDLQQQGYAYIRF